MNSDQLYFSILNDDLPMRRAHELADALARYLDDVKNDEPGDDPDLEPLFRQASTKADALVSVIRRLYKEDR